MLQRYWPAVLAAFAVAVPAPALAAACRADGPRIDAAIEAVNGKQRNVGVQAAIWRDGSIVYSQAFGHADLEKKRAATRATPFGVASLTKGFTGVAALLAHQRGQLDLDAPVQRYVPEFPVRTEGVITPRSLAAHYSGLPQWREEDRKPLYSRRFTKLGELVPLYRDVPLKPVAFKEYSYSSIGYNLLGLAVERATGVGFQDYVRRTIIRPLNLSRTDFDDLPRRPADLAVRYSWIDITNYYQLPAPERVPVLDYSHNMAGGNMYSTAEDMARFGGALTAPGLLGQATLDRLYTRVSMEGVKPGPVTYGWFASAPGSERRLNLTGSNAGLQAGVFVYPERRLAVAVLANSWGIGSSSGELVYDLPQRLADLCAPRPTPAA